jgi:hypothetical protein
VCVCVWLDIVVGSNPSNLNERSWSSGYDRRLPSDGPGFNSRRTHFFGNCTGVEKEDTGEIVSCFLFKKGDWSSGMILA